MVLKGSGYTFFEKMQVREKVCELECALIGIVSLGYAKGLGRVTANNLVINIGQRKLDNGLIDFANQLPVQHDVLVLVSHVILHSRQQMSITHGPGGKIIIDSMGILFTVKIEIEDQSMQHRIAANVAMKTALDDTGNQRCFTPGNRRRKQRRRPQ